VKSSSSSSWQTRLRTQLPRLGHRNWVVVTDAAYPLQTSPGIETLVATQPLTTVLGKVLQEIKRAPHIRPLVYTDAELEAVAEEHAPGVTKFRRNLAQTLAKASVRSLPHEEIIARLDAAGRSFQIMLIKTPELIPYTSVFLELDCGYWNAEAEKALRDTIARNGKKS
jgi:D-ribose pyranose/furanose isomerase RbsD